MRTWHDKNKQTTEVNADQTWASLTIYARVLCVNCEGSTIGNDGCAQCKTIVMLKTHDKDACFGIINWVCIGDIPARCRCAQRRPQ